MTSTEQSFASAAEAQPTFAQLGLPESVLAAVGDMGYAAPTPVQAAAIPEALAGRDILAAAQTGTGKTAAFLLPTMARLPRVPRTRSRGRAAAQGPLMLVVTPTRELAQQIEDVCRSVAAHTKHRSVTVVGGVGYNPQKDALRRGCDILIATPGRLLDLIDQEACRLDQVQVLVLDEADRMLDMGFLPAVRRIVGYTPADRQTLLFSATLDEKAVGSITDLVRDPARVEIAPVTSTADTVDQYVLPVSLEAKNALLASVLKREGAERVIVFTRTKHRADACSRRLARAGITCAAIHGDRSQNQRERALRAFRAGECSVLVATDVLARGIDITDVRYVVNFDVPEDPVDYIHRIGRTGRAGEAGWSLTFVTETDVEEFYDIEALMGKTADVFDAAGLDVGAHPPVVDPERVPAAAPAGKKEKKRRRAKAAARTGRSQRQGRPERAQAHGAAGGVGETEAPARKHEDAASHDAKPSRRKRSGKTRVRAADETASVELLSGHEAAEAMREAPEGGRSGRSRGRARGGDARGGARDGREGGRSEARGSRGRSGSGRGKRASGDASTRGGQVRRDESGVLHTGRAAQDVWRNYDEPSERRGRGGRGGRGPASGTRAGRAGGRDARNASASAPRRSTRRPGDRGGRR